MSNFRYLKIQYSAMAIQNLSRLHRKSEITELFKQYHMRKYTLPLKSFADSLNTGRNFSVSFEVANSNN